HTRLSRDWSSDVCSSDLQLFCSYSSSPNDSCTKFCKLATCMVMFFSMVSQSSEKLLICTEINVRIPKIKITNKVTVIIADTTFRSEERRVVKEWKNR